MIKYKYCTTVFRDKKMGYEIKIDTYSKYTLIDGLNSGEGKTHFFSYIQDGLNNGTLDIYNSKNLRITLISDNNVLDLALNATEKQIIIIDDILLLSRDNLKRVNKCKHIVICISRSESIALPVPIYGIYKVRRCKDGDNILFEIHKYMRIRLYGIENIEFEKIITEAKSGRSEHELLSIYLNNVIGAGGNSRVFRELKKLKNKYVLVLLDLGNIGGIQDKILSTLHNRPDVYFYDYNCFEELLLKSKMFDIEVAIDEIIEHISIEKFYEYKLSSVSHYEHGKKLPETFKDVNNVENIFNTEVGEGLYFLIRKQRGDFAK